MSLFEKITVSLLATTLITGFTFGLIISLAITREGATTEETLPSTTSTPSTVSSSSSDDIDMSQYITYFDLAYAAYTNPSKFIDKEVTLVGYYSSSESVNSDTSDSNVSVPSESNSDTSKSDKVYHFITTYGQIDECHITAEFTTVDNKYPELGTVIKITGKFTSYEENGNTYYTIAADSYSEVNT